MGFFSWECAECGGSIRNQYADDDARTKHRGITHVRPDGVVAGTYEGSGWVKATGIWVFRGSLMKTTTTSRSKCCTATATPARSTKTCRNRR